MEIRRLTVRDVTAVEHICLATASEKCNRDDIAKELTLLMYNRYYTRTQAENCFVLADDNDRAVGYILCAPDYSEYKKSFSHNELREIGGYSFLHKVSAYVEIMSDRMFSKQYPAHLHIDILPEYQHGGWGTKLMDALVANLTAKHVCGVMLGVSADNKNAIAFYEKNGFNILLKTKVAYVMGRKL